MEMDDLVVRLRDPSRDWPEFWFDRTDAATHIEELEAKLAKAAEVAAHTAYVECAKTRHVTLGLAVSDAIRAALADLKGDDA